MGKDSELLTTRFVMVRLLYHCSLPLSLSKSTKRVACRIIRVLNCFVHLSSHCLESNFVPTN